MSVRISVDPSMLIWARERSGLGDEAVYRRFPKLSEWESGHIDPTLKQLEQYATATYTPFGYLFLTEPPDEPLPVPDYRTIRDNQVTRPSANLLDSLFQSEQRQDWYRQYLRHRGSEPLSFVGSTRVGAPAESTAAGMRESLGFDVGARKQFSTWSDALRGLIEATEALGVLVVVNGIVGSNTHRKLDPEEFRGFTLVDDLAPLIFLNGADTKAAQIFTLAHELAHVWAGQSGVDRPDLSAPQTHGSVERWCNEVAAEFLVPLSSLPSKLDGPTLTDDLERIARAYKVSTLVALRRLVDRGLVTWEQFGSAFSDELTRVKALAARSAGGGNFYLTQPYRVSRLFARAIISDALEGETLYRDAYRLLGVRRHETFENLGQSLGVGGL